MMKAEVFQVSPRKRPSLARTPFDRMDFARTPRAQRAFARFRVARRLVVLSVSIALGALAAAMLEHAHARDLRLAACLGFLSLAALVELAARGELKHALAREGEAMGLSEGTARHFANAFLGRVLDEHLTPSERLPPVTMTEPDVQRLRALLYGESAKERPIAKELAAELSRAEVLPSRKIPIDVVTMNSRVVYEDEDTGLTREITLVYPHDADSNQERVSILSPLGSALIGLRAGQAIDWFFPQIGCKRLRVLAVPYQPEAAGDFHL
jgi:regulator of nucleoside diphosphate kinase